MDNPARTIASLTENVRHPDFDFWLRGVVSTCQLIASDALRRVWVERESGITSIYSPDELLEQLLGDLRVGEQVELFGDQLQQLGVFYQLGRFAASLLDLDQAMKAHPELERPGDLMASVNWAAVKQAAQAVLDLRQTEIYRMRTALGDLRADDQNKA